ncbi:MAG: exodeoxyribonuclease III, partial [Erysipelotrichaceae bacterium]|nr:exodeoxyribonuclease III [Erysipelotrichaceae bacterium]
YSSTAVFSRKEPISIMLDFEDNGIHPREGRVMTLEYNSFYLVNAYVPNSKEQLARLDYRMLWEEDLLKHLNKLNESKPVIYCGDLNVAHEEIDIKNPAANHFSAGFSDQEREKMTQLLNSGYTDTFRWLYPNTVRYSWWSYRFNARANNAGWRIDYFIVSDRIRDKVTDSIIHDEITGSDHCPVELDIDI